MPRVLVNESSDALPIEKGVKTSDFLLGLKTRICQRLKALKMCQKQKDTTGPDNSDEKGDSSEQNNAVSDIKSTGSITTTINTTTAPYRKSIRFTTPSARWSNPEIQQWITDVLVGFGYQKQKAEGIAAKYDRGGFTLFLYDEEDWVAKLGREAGMIIWRLMAYFEGTQKMRDLCSVKINGRQKKPPKRRTLSDAEWESIDAITRTISEV